MKKIFTILAIVLFTINASAQDTKTASKESQDKYVVTKDTDVASTEVVSTEVATKTKSKSQASGKSCGAGEMAKCDKKEGKKCCAKKE